MSSLHVPQRFTQISRTFSQTDSGAMVVLLIGIATLGLIAAYLFN
jgi:hypothetical protein